MKKLLLIICSIFLLGNTLLNAQITFRGCTSNALGAQDYILVATGTTNDAGTIRNTYESNPADFTQGCPAGVCEIRIMWNIGASRWEVSLDNDGPIGTPDYTTACLYYNASPSYPNPPDLTLGSWLDCSGGSCPAAQFVTMTGDVQSSISACTDPDVPTITATPATICTGNTSTLTWTGTLNDATNWYIYTGSCGGTQIGTTAGSTFVVNPTSTTTYFIRGEGGCVTPGSCGSVTVTVNPLDNASFNYSASAYCVNDADPTPTITGLGGGTFSSGAGLSINASTGQMDVSASTPGTYTVTYTTAGSCPNSSGVSITINALDDASFNYSAASYCANDSDPTPTITGLAGGTFSSGAGLSINASTGAVDVSASTPGTYTVTYTTSGTCPNSSNVAVTINALDNASFNYSASAYCSNDSDPTPTITGLGGGTFSSTAGLSINASTGAVDVSTSTPGTYTVTYTTSGTCPNSSNVAVTINALDNAGFNYSASAYCVNDADPTPTITGLGGGTFSSTAGLSINAGTGAVDVSASTPGTYTVTYTTAGSCPNSSAVSVTINALDNASFNYSASSYCVNDADPTPTITGLGGGTFSSTAGLSINAGTGAVDVSASTPGTYTVTYTTSGTCPNSSNVAVTINALDNASFNYSASAYCVNDADPTPTITGLGGGTFSSTAGLSINAGTGAVDVSASTPGTYTVTYTTAGSCPNSSNVSVTINAIPNTPSGTGATICSGQTATISATNSGGTTQWFSDAGLSNLEGTGTVFTTPNLTANTDYYVVEIDATSCESNSTIVSVLVNSLPNTPSVSNINVCEGEDVIISATGSGSGDIIYYDNSLTEIGRVTMPPANTSQNIGALATGNYTYYAAEDNGTCVSNYDTIAVSVNSLPAPPSASGTTVCSNESATLSANGTGNIKWYTDAALISLVDTGVAYVTPNLTTNTDYFVTQVTSNNCESPATTVSITVLPALTGSVTNTICNNESVMVNGTTYNAATPNGTEVFTNVGPNNCDSTVTINLNVLPALTGSVTNTICDGDSIVVNGTTYNTSVTGATEVFTNVGPNNCDSTVTINLTVEPAIDITVSNTSPTLTANQSGASYQWLDCDNANAPIASETGQSFTATVNGNYAVIVTVGSCSDTSACENITGVGIKEAASNVVSIYPNPTNGMFTIRLANTNQAVSYTITTLEGRLVEQANNVTTNNIEVDLTDESKGVYLLRITEGNSNSIYKIVRQ